MLQPMDIEMELIDARAHRSRGRTRGVPSLWSRTGERRAGGLFDLLWVRNGLVYRRRTFYSEQEALEATAIATNAASSSLSDGRRGERYLRLKPAPVQSVVLIKIHPAQRRCCLRARGAASQSSALCFGVAGRNSGSIDDAYRRRH